MRRLAPILAALAALSLLPATASAQPRPRGDVRVLAQIGLPGFPALAYVHPNGRIYVGTYVNPNGGSAASRVFEYAGDGDLIRSWTVPGQDVASGEQGVQVTTSDSKGRLVLLDQAPARAIKLDRGSGDFTAYSTFADIKPCAVGQAQPNCSPTLQDQKPAPNYGAWGPDGSLYVTDYHQGVIWRVPPGGGPARVWLSDRRFDGSDFGTTGIALGADRRTLFIGQGSSAGLADGNPATGKLYAVPIQPNGTPGAMRKVYESGPAELPDGFAIARSGNFYVPLAGGNAIAVVTPDGRETGRFTSPTFDTPTSARFLGTRIVVPNQSAIAGDRAKQLLVDIETREAGLQELIPGLDRVAPRLTKAKLSRKRLRPRARKRRARVARVRFRVSEKGTITVRAERVSGKRVRLIHDFVKRTKKGRNSVLLSSRIRSGKRVRKMPRGRYRLLLRARDASGNRSRRVRLRFRVVR